MTKKYIQIAQKIKAQLTQNKTLEFYKTSAKESTAEQQLIYAFCACYMAIKEGLGLDTFDEQLYAALALNDGKVVEMVTGEGKTLSAVYAAYLNAVQGQSVHILTFNDYLAKRDYFWMKPAYDLLDITTGYISEDMEYESRKSAYNQQVTYVTAKECGFDFLRDFVESDADKMVHRGFDYAIVDEADSLLIDEARIPLVIAGNVAVEPDEDLPVISALIKQLEDKHYKVDLETQTAYLTEKGLDFMEENLACGNLYDEGNHTLLTKITDCLKAQFLLKENKDYIVKDGEIRIIDEFTGRVVQNRHYPGGLQSAVEVKENITTTQCGTVMGTVPLQFFVRQYKKLCGMTGTALSAEDEFYQLYDLKLEIIPTHVPCKRKDNPMTIFTHADAKWNAVAKKIEEIHTKGQPVLVGTASIEESETLAEKLGEKSIECVVLNAKNNEQEAEIIKNAGALNAVTISTNMAGRGVDIKLGGADESQREQVVSAGGLFIIGTHIGESSRITSQLRGRAGRQGDIGESVFYISLDDEIMRKYELLKLIPKRHIPENQAEPIEDKVVIREVERIQRIAEGQSFEFRKRLLKYTMIGEKHRKATFTTRLNFITGKSTPHIWQENCPEEYAKAVEKFGKEEIDELQRKIAIQSINEFWCDYLEYTSYLREGIHLTRVGGKNPADEYNIVCETYYDGMEEQLINCMVEKLEGVLALDSLSDYVITTPTSIWTYTLNESGDELLKKSFIEEAMTDREIEELADEWEQEALEKEQADETQNQGETQSENENATPVQNAEKQGFFKKLFGKK